MENYKNSNWIKWENRNNLEGIKYPGIYIIAVTSENIEGQSFKMIENIEYIGMTNSNGGLRSRLNQFDSTIKRIRLHHGGAHRFIGKYWNYEEVKNNLYISICPFKCSNDKKNMDDLLAMGEVAKAEYIFWIKYIKEYGRYPLFNDKNKSPKPNFISVFKEKAL
ncbi:hypothetical protein [Flavobacterium sp. UMI-01]|uniref:hypothetical protein n=1 Tax=Flavobacterium sp. UMI-01 TaxID=1441053 RepID=UPI001C7DD1CC|nr:hypothetical protein [Flavobacterium sp. UMI-01]GIZ07914.1 hypothetical protein FUMI01_06410 [Flavobacterium sp. UMI-01]